MNQQRAPLKAFLLDHKDWLEKVSGDLIRRKGRTVDEYILDFIKPGFKFDELALLAFVRMHHKHIFVLMDGRFWTSRKDNDVTRCDLKFGYVGNLLFVPLLHESAVHRRFKDGTRCVNMFLRPRLERRSKGYDVPSHFSTECSELMFTDRFCTDISETFVCDELPCDVGIEYKFVDNTSFTPENVCYSSKINDVNSDVDVKVCLSEASCSDECTNPIGTAHVIFQEHTTDNTDDIPLSSHEKATDEPLCVEVSKQTDVHVGNKSEENIEFSDNSGNVSPLPQVVTQVGDSIESPGSASPVYDNVTDQEVNIAVEKSATISDEKQSDLLVESVVNDVEASESNHTESSEGTGNSANPLIPQNEEASIVQKTNLDSNVTTENELDGTAQIPPVLPNILPNMEETEASKSTEIEDKIEENSDDGNLAVYVADTDIETPLGTESPKPKPDINPSSTAGETDSDSAVDIDKWDEDSCSCSGSCTCSSSSSSSSDDSSIEGSATNGEPQNTGKRGKRKYSDASDQANHSEHESRPVKRKLRQYLKKKPDYAVDSSSSEEGEGSQDSESNESEDEFVTVQTKTKKVVKKILKTKSGQIEIQHFKLKSKKIRKRTYRCKYCDHVSTTQKEHNQYIKQKHDDAKHICFHCSRTFDSENGLYKHERSHYNLPYGCSQCQKRFQFPYQVSAHLKVHTQKNLYKCLHCPKEFTTNLNMKTHAKTHFDKFTCTHNDCKDSEKVYTSKGNLSQHIRGEHGPGWKAFCGEHIKWKSKYNRHINKCTECQQIREKKKKQRYHFL